MRLKLGQHRQQAQRPVGHDKRALKAVLLQMGSDQFARACAKADGGGKGKRSDGHRKMRKK